MLILVRGLPGTGKTFFSEKFSASIGAVHISSDRVRDELLLRGHYHEDAKARVYEEMCRRAAQVLAEKRSCLLDATFSKQPRIHAAHQLAVSAKVPFFVIEMTADEALIRRRVHKKRAYSEADFDVYQKIREAYDAVPGKHLQLNSSILSPDDMLLKAKRYIEDDRNCFSTTQK